MFIRSTITALIALASAANPAAARNNVLDKMTSNRDLGSVAVPPNQNATISYSPLYPGVNYDVNCTLISTAPADVYFNVGNEATLDGKPFTNVAHSIGLNALQSLVINNVNTLYQKSLQIANLDDEAIVAVSNCVAGVGVQRP